MMVDKNINKGDKYSDQYKVIHDQTGNYASSSPASMFLFSPSSFLSPTTTTSSNEDGGDTIEKNPEMKKHHTCKTMTMGPKLSETVKGKLRLGAKIIRKGGRENIFKEVFGENDEEKLLKASQCYLSTTAGPIAGVLFISTQKVAFCSDRSITLRSPNGDLIRKPYKVLIPISKIKEANKSENVDNTAQKYIEIVTDDNFEFWFMGFVRYEKAFRNLRKALSY